MRHTSVAGSHEPHKQPPGFRGATGSRRGDLLPVAGSDKHASGGQHDAGAGRTPVVSGSGGSSTQGDAANARGSTSITGILAKMRGFNSAAGTGAAARNATVRHATHKPHEAGSAAHEASVLPLTERKEAGLRAIEHIREMLTGSRPGRPLMASRARIGGAQGRFAKRESGGFAMAGGGGSSSSNPATPPKGMPPSSANSAPQLTVTGAAAGTGSSPKRGAASRSAMQGSAGMAAALSWTDDAEFVYDLLRSEELHQMLAVADAAWASNAGFRSTVVNGEMREYLRSLFIFDDSGGSEEEEEGEEEGGAGGEAPTAVSDVHDRLRAPGRPSFGHHRKKGGGGHHHRERDGAPARTVRRSLADGDLDICDLLINSLSVRDAKEAELSRWKERILAADEEVSVFELSEHVADPLTFIAMVIFQRHRLPEAFGIGYERMHALCAALNAGYSDENHFHNRLHAADVTLAMHLFVCHSGMVEAHEIQPLHLLALFFGTLVHDLGHPGVTNAFLVNSSNPLALTYNDRSVLENFHVSEAFKLIQQTKYNIFRAVEAQHLRELRSLVIKMVLATDMAEHFAQVTELVSTAPAPPGTPAERQPPALERDRLMAIMVHAADISHPFRQLRAHLEWSRRVRDEFLSQGDIERKLGLPVMPMFDRDQYKGESQYATQQIGFIQAIVKPLLDALCSHFAPLKPRMEPLLERTLEHWAFIRDHGNGHVPPPPPPKT